MKTIHVLTDREKAFLLALESRTELKDGFSHAKADDKFREEWAAEIEALKPHFFKPSNSYYITYVLNDEGKRYQHYARTGDSALTLYYCQADYGQVFWDNDGEIIGGLHEHDGEFVEEHMAKLFTHFGIVPKYVEDVPDQVLQWGKGDWWVEYSA